MIEKFQANIDKYRIIAYSFILTALYSSIGYHFGTDDHIEHFVTIFRAIDPQFLINDFFVNVNTGFGPRFYYSNLMAILSHIAPLTIIFFILVFISNFLVFLITYNFCKRLLTNNNLACVLIPAFMMFFAKFSLGGSGVIWDTYLTPTSLAIPFILAAIYVLFIRNNLVLANILLAISCLIHPLLAFYGWIVSFGSLFIRNLLSKNKVKSKEIFNLILFPLILLVFWVIPKQIFMKGTIPRQEFINIVAYFALPMHYIPSQFPITSYLKYIALLIAFAILIHISIKNKLLNNNYIRLRLFYLSLISMIILIFLWIIGFIFSEVIPIKFFVFLQTFKSNSLFNWYLLVSIITLAVQLRHTNIKGRNFLFLFILILLIVVSLPYSGRFALFPFICLIPFFWIFYFKRTVISTFLPVIFIIVFLVFFLCSNHRIAAKLRSIVHTMPTLSQSCEKDQYGIISDKERLEVINYVKKSTNIDEVFLTPPGWGAFRYCAKRAIVVAFKVGSFREVYMKEWKERIDNCYGTVSLYGGYFEKVKKMQSNYTNITLDKLEVLSKKYHFDYAILPVNCLVDKNIVFQNDKYKISKISSKKVEKGIQ